MRLMFIALLLTPSIATAELRPNQQKLLSYYDALFDPTENLLKVAFSSPGYHTKFQDGDLVHPTRESFYYAIALLQRGKTNDVSRAGHILKTVLPLQETKRTDPAYGVWPYLLEEPLGKMESVDLNWADFCGAAISQILVEHGHQLDVALQRQMTTALSHAAHAIRQRDVKPGYTNIAVLGGGVCAVAGEILKDCLLYTSPSPRDATLSRMPSSA